MIGVTWFIDWVELPRAKSGWKGYFDAREGASGWVEARMCKKHEAIDCAKFMEEEVFLRHGACEVIISDRGECGSELVKNLVESYGAKLRHTPAYSPWANGVCENGHRHLANSLSKMIQGKEEKWPDYFQAAIWADRITIKDSRGFSPFYLMYARNPILPIDLWYDTYYWMKWKEKMSTEELLQMRAAQILVVQRKRELVLDKVYENRRYKAAIRNRERGRRKE
jgi:hypothetical protein